MAAPIKKSGLSPAKTPSGGMAKNNKLLSEEELLAALGGQSSGTGSTGNAGSTGSAASPGYYKRPELGADADALSQQVTSAEKAAMRNAQALEKAQSSLGEAEEALSLWTPQMQALKEAYERTGSAADLDRYTRAQEQMYLLLDKVARAQNGYDSAYSGFQSSYGSYTQAIDSYNSYMQQQRQQFSNWKSTIRDGAAVRSELDQVEQEIARQEELDRSARANAYSQRQDEKPWYEKLAGYLAGVQDTTLPTSAAPAAAQPSASAQLQQLLDRKALLQEELDWSEYYRYADLMGMEDFAQLSGYRDTSTGREPVIVNMQNGPYYTETGFGDISYDYINRNPTAISRARQNAMVDNTAIMGGDREHLEQMTDEEISIFNYLYATKGADAAYEYIAYLTKNLNYRQRKEDEERAAAAAREKPVLQSLKSIAMAPVRGLSYIGQAADYLHDGRIDENAKYNQFSYIPTAIRAQVSNTIAGSGKWGKVGSFAYQTGMSLADFLLSTAVSGGSQAVSLAIMGTGAAADATIAAKDRGLSDGQAFALGTIAGLAEVVTEKVSLDTLLNPSLLREGAIPYILKNALAEGSEEVGSDVINLVADILIAKDQSQWQAAIDDYMAKGKTEGEAFGLALADQAATMGADFLGGLISGGIMGSGGAAINSIQTGKLAGELEDLDLSGEDVQAFIETGLQSDPDSDAYQIARQLQEKLNAGKKITARDVARQYQANIEAVDKEAASGSEAEADEVPGLTLPVLEDTGEGVTNNEQTGRQPAASDTAGRIAAGAVYGSGQRTDGAGTEGEAGGVAGRAEPAAPGNRAAADTRRKAAERIHLAEDLRLEKVSSLSLGVPEGTANASLQVLPEEHWTPELTAKAEEIYQQTGKKVRYVLGAIEFRNAAGGVGLARGVITEDGILVRADHFGYGPEQIADHEAYHGMKTRLLADGLNMDEQLLQRIRETFSREEFDKVLDKYIIALREVIDVAGADSTEQFQQRMDAVVEEVLADAYAGMNAFSAGADRFTDTVRGFLDEKGLAARPEQANGTKEATGPPEGTRFSIVTLPDGKKYVRADRQVIFGNDPDSWSEQAEDYINGRIRRGQDVPLIADDGRTFMITSETAGKMSDNHTGYGTTMNDELFYVKSNAAVHVDELVRISSPGKGVTKPDYEGRHGSFASSGWEYRTVFFLDFDGKYYKLILSIAVGDKGSVPYNIGKIKEGSFPKISSSSAKGGAEIGETSLEERVSQNPDSVNSEIFSGGDTREPRRAELAVSAAGGNTKFSVDGADSLGNPLTAEQQDYFRDSVVRDAEGRLLPVYHGSRAKFTEFQHKFINSHGSAEGRGFYFTDSKSMAQGYEREGGQLLQGYLNIAKPLSNDALTITRAQMRQLLKTVDPTGDEVLVNVASTSRGYPSTAWYNKALSEAVDVFMNNDSDAEALAELATCGAGNEAVMRAVREKFGYDGYIVKDRYENATVYVAFASDQFKNQDNASPTKSPDFRYSVDEAGEAAGEQGGEARNSRRPKQASKPKQDAKPPQESLPIRAKQDLRKTLLNLFSIPAGRRTEIGNLIDWYADYLLRRGSLTDEDRKAFFDRMYEEGVMVLPGDESAESVWDYMRKGKIYVPESVRAELGDDWNSFRRRAFALGIYLTNNRADVGIDVWNMELAALLPGAFSEEELDMTSILRRIVSVAEEGKGERLSLPEYTARLAGREEISEDEFLDHMERQLDIALRTFAEKAELEIELRDRTGTKLAKQREALDAKARLAAAKAEKRWLEERQARKDAAKRQRDRKALQELQQKTLKQLRWLSRNRSKAPEDLKAAFDEILGDIDLYAVSAANEMRWSERHGATWKDLAQMYKDAMENDPNFMPSAELQRIVTRLDADKIGDMDIGALQDLYKAAVGLRTEFYNRNNVINDEMHRLFAQVYTDAKQEIESAPGGYTGKRTDKFLNMEQLTPMNVLQRMGGWNPDGAFYSMAKQLERGERDVRAFKVKAQEMLQQFLAEHEDWVKLADGQGKDAIWYELEVPQLLQLRMGDKPVFGDTVKVYMTPAQKVHLYLESKNQDNLRHMTGGRTFADKELYSKGKRQEAFGAGTTIKLAPETVKQIVSDLTEEELALAAVLERYYNTFATGEINRVSNILYGYDKAMGSFYAPIYTNSNYTKSEFGVFDVTAEGVGNLKERKHAVNPSYNISALDAFEKNVDKTARFVGMAIPTRNWTTLMNWRTESNSTADVITHKWGEEGKRYITDLIETLQGGDLAKTDVISGGAGKLLNNYITAIFGANPSIVLKQLGSIPLASVYLGPGNAPKLAQIRSIDRDLIGKYTKDLAWRTMGYSSLETKQLKDNPNWTQTNKFWRFTFGGGAITAMDGWAASVLWPWAENKVRKEHPELEVGSQAAVDQGESPFYKKVAEEFENAVSRSQSVSDEIHQSSLRKSKNPVAKAFTMFRSDAAQTYNALRQKIGEAQYYKRTGADEKLLKAATGAVGAAFLGLLLNAMWSESISFLMAMWKNKGKYYRDDEDDLTAGSVMGEMAGNMVASMAGTVTFGEELCEILGAVFLGENRYDIEVPGMEQVNDAIDAVVIAGGGLREMISGGAEVVRNGGDFGKYLKDNAWQLLGHAKELAETVAMYGAGIPVSNVEAYLLGAVKWCSPELGDAYDDLMDKIGKSDLSGLDGERLVSRVERLLTRRGIEVPENAAATLAQLYTAGYKAAVPGDVPSSVSIDGDTQALNAYQQQAYGTVWTGVVNDALEGLIASDGFAAADEETKAKLLGALYDYAKERAKSALFDTYEQTTAADTIDALAAGGLSIAECVEWRVSTTGLKNAQKYEALLAMDADDKAKAAVVGTIIGTDMTTESGNPSQYAKFQELLKAGVSVDQYLEMRLDGVDPEDVLDLTDAGMDEDLALDFAAALEAGDPDKVSRWKICVEFSEDVEDQLTALSMVMTDSQMIGVEVAHGMGVAPRDYVGIYDALPAFDADGNGAYKQAEVKAAIDATMQDLTLDQKAALWQLVTGSSSAKNNPYSRTAGQQALDAKQAAKDQAAGGGSSSSFAEELRRQLSGE